MKLVFVAAILTVSLLSVSCDKAKLDKKDYEKQKKASKQNRKQPKDGKTPCWQTVQYSVVNECDWNSMRHPRDYPSDGHWSPLCGITHHDEGRVFKIGGVSSDGFKEVAETGKCSMLESELSECANTYFCGDFLSYPCSAKDSGTCRHEGTFSAEERYTYVSLASMVAPSPDWFVGVDSVNLCEDGYWMPKYEKYLMGNDAGTDGGTTFTSSDIPLSQRQPISVFDAKDESNVFFNKKQGKLHPLCKITVTLKSS